MGVAKSNRGSVVVRRQIDEALDMPKRHYFGALDRINEMPRGKGKPFGPVVIEPPAKSGGAWWLLSAGEDRHSHYGYHYASLRALMADWSLAVTGFTSDKNGRYYTTEVL